MIHDSRFTNFGKYLILPKLLITKQRGFTLLEVLLSSALLVILLSSVLPLSFSAFRQNELNTTTYTLIQTLRRAQTLSLAGYGDSSWGVAIQQGTITFFKGSSFATRESSYDEHIPYSSLLTPSGASEVIFQKITGELISSQLLTLSSTNDARTLSINQQGVISY